MELFVVLFGFFAIAALFVPWITLFRTQRLELELSRIRQEMSSLKSELVTLKLRTAHGGPLASTSASAATPETSIPEQPQAQAHHAPALSPTPLPMSGSVPSFTSPEPLPRVQKEISYDDFEWDDRETLPLSKTDAFVSPVEDSSVEKSSFEFNIGTKLPVWIGAISLVCAGFFLVKYSIDMGLLGPIPRVIIGLFFGLGMAVAGRLISQRPNIPNALRMAQGLVGAGLITLTFSLYSAVHMYHIIEPLTGFCGMIAIVVATMALALKLGQPVAIFGLVGGFLAPALFSTNEPNFVGLFCYLFVLYTGLQTVMYRQKWWNLSIASVAGVFIWSLLALVSPDFKEEGSLLAIFVLAISAMTVFSGRHLLIKDDAEYATEPSSGPHFLNLVAIAGSTLVLILLQNKLNFSLLDWAMSDLMSLGVLGLAYLRPAQYSRAVWGKLVSDCVLLAIYLPSTPSETGIGVALSLFAIYALVPALLLRTRGNEAKFWAITQTSGSILLYLTTYSFLSPTEAPENQTYWGGIALLGALYATSQVKRWLNTNLDDIVAIYALATTSFLSIGLAILLPMSYLPTAIALEIAATLWIYQKLHIAFLQRIAQILLGVFIVLELPLIADFVNLSVSSLLAESAYLSPKLLSIGVLLQSFLIPALGLGAACTLYSRQKSQQDIMHYGLIGSTVLLLMGAAYMTIRIVFNGDMPQQLPLSGFTEREIVTLMMVLFAVLTRGYASEQKLPIAARWADGLIIVAILRNIYFDLGLYNPLFHAGQNVGSLPLINGITLTYGAALAVVLYAKSKQLGSDIVSWAPSGLKVLALLFLFVLTSLNVRQLFHGADLESGIMSNSELYSYSIVWMLTGLGLLTYGFKQADRNLRLAALAFLTLTIGKVFLVDASELEGLYRIFSFLGLGVSLIGLSMFYTRFISQKGNPRD